MQQSPAVKAAYQIWSH